MKKVKIELLPQELITLKFVLKQKLNSLRLGRIIKGKPFKRASSYEARIRELCRKLKSK